MVGSSGQARVRMQDTYTAFREQMLSFISFVQTGRKPFAFAQTIELMATIIAGLRSRERNSQRVLVAEILQELST